MTDHASGLTRPRYFQRQQLTADDLNAAIEYVRERQRRHNRMLHGWGVVCGAQVLRHGAWEVRVTEGLVLTPRGDEVAIPAGAAYDVREGVQSCLPALFDPCPEPWNLSATASAPPPLAELYRVYLAVYPDEQYACPQPAIPAECQPPGGVYAWSRIREGHRFEVLCALPGHSETSCADATRRMCEQALVPCPPPVEEDDGGRSDAVVLATLLVDCDGIVAVENLAPRRLLPSVELMQAMLRCQCAQRPPGAIWRIEPNTVVLGYGGTTVVPRVVISGSQLDGASAVVLAGEGGTAAVVSNADPGALVVRVQVAANAALGGRAFAVLFPDGRPSLVSTDFGVVLWVRGTYGVGWDSGIGGDLL